MRVTWRGARRMLESATRLVDHVFPEVAVMQFVLTFPFPLRLLLAVHPEALNHRQHLGQRFRVGREQESQPGGKSKQARIFKQGPVSTRF